MSCGCVGKAQDELEAIIAWVYDAEGGVAAASGCVLAGVATAAVDELIWMAGSAAVDLVARDLLLGVSEDELVVVAQSMPTDY